MKRIVMLPFLLLASTQAFASYLDFTALPVDSQLTQKLQEIAKASLQEPAAAKLTPDNFSITVIDLDSEGGPERASVNGDQTYHPASVVKLFFLIAAHERMRAGKLVMSSELQRALTDMIVESNNDATSYVVDAVTGTASGPELSGRAWHTFERKRNWLNGYYADLGYDVSVNGKAFCEGPYGRDKQLLGEKREHRNRITSRAVAALMDDIVEGRAAAPAATASMLGLMHRNPSAAATPGENQVKGFGGEGLPPGSEQWSKAGWTSEVRHDAMYVKLPNGHRYIAVMLTRGLDAENEQLLPVVSKLIAALFTER
ncbi:MAG: serine hydrolase [Acidobacteriota bacterium]